VRHLAFLFKKNKNGGIAMQLTKKESMTSLELLKEIMAEVGYCQTKLKGSSRGCLFSFILVFHSNL
jgi:hypothetical protein